ncbi:MAG: hypothetical protein A2Z98_12625 [Spirochaetes bacterium GWB1_27_13]|nr:MAG: hypothetical protein A2Z98_12625 [Spirochaetes bacterium GWB1_27_13]
MELFNKTQEEIKTELITAFKNNEYINLTNYNVGGVLRGIFEVVAFFIWLFYDLLNKIFKNAFVQTAEGDWLDLKCTEVGITRKQAVKTIGLVKFARNIAKDENIKIKKGTIVKTKTNSKGKEFVFYTTEEKILVANQTEVFVPVAASYEGKDYNVATHAISILSTTTQGIDYIDNFSDWITTPGEDKECDEDLRARYFLQWTSLAKDSASLYKRLALETQGVTDAVIISEPRGKGTFDLIIRTVSGSPSQEIIIIVSNKINAVREPGIEISVKGPTIKNISINIQLIFYNNVFNFAEKETIAYDAVIAYFNKLKISQDFILSQLATEISTSLKGFLKDIKITSPTQNVTATKYEILQISNIVFSSTKEEEI